MSRLSFFKLLEELKPFITPNHRCITAGKKKLGITLYYLKDTGSLSMTANLFGLHITTTLQTSCIAFETIIYHLGSKYVRLPKDENEMRKKVAEFEVKYGLVQVFGCIDGTHILIKRPIMIDV